MKLSTHFAIVMTAAVIPGGAMLGCSEQGVRPVKSSSKAIAEQRSSQERMNHSGEIAQSKESTQSKTRQQASSPSQRTIESSASAKDSSGKSHSGPKGDDTARRSIAPESKTEQTLQEHPLRKTQTQQFPSSAEHRREDALSARSPVAPKVSTREAANPAMQKERIEPNSSESIQATKQLKEAVLDPNP